MGWDTILLLAAATFAATVSLLAVWRGALLRWQFLDRPGRRSSHRVPTPTGGGVAVTAVAVAAWLVQAWPAPDALAIGTVAGVLCLVSWLDDVRGLPPAIRLGLHFAAALAGVWLLWPAMAAAAGGTATAWWLAAALAVAWVWFINLYNFMDGIDGLAGVETACLALGVLLVSRETGGTFVVQAPAVVLAGGAAAFLVWNWHPAKLFMGDSGSVPLGFLIGWLLLHLALEGAWLAAAILPLYYVADATITLCRRAWRRQPVWQAHREHFYQKAVQRGLGHDRVTARIALCNIVLIGLALLSLSQPAIAAVGAAAAVAALLWNLHGGRRRLPRTTTS